MNGQGTVLPCRKILAWKKKMTKLLTLRKNSTLDMHHLLIYYKGEVNALQKQGNARQMSILMIF